MALTQSQLSGLYQQYFGRQAGPQDIAALGGQGGAWSKMDPNQFIQNTIIPSQEFQSKYPGVNTIGGFQQAQAQNQAKAVFDPLVKQGQAASQQQFEALKKTIGLQKTQAEEGVRTSLAARGLLDTSKFGSDIAQIENTAQTQLGNAQQAMFQADQTLQQWATQNIYGQASTQQQANFNEVLQSQNQQFGQWLQTQNLDANLFATLPTAWQTFLTMNNTLSEQQYNDVRAIAQSIGIQPPQ